MASGYLHAFFSSLLEKYRPSLLAALLLFLHFLQCTYCSFRILHDYEAPRPELLKGALPSFATRVSSFLPCASLRAANDAETVLASRARGAHSPRGKARKAECGAVDVDRTNLESRRRREGERILRKRMHVCTASTHRAGAKRCQNLQGGGERPSRAPLKKSLYGHDGCMGEYVHQ